MTTKPRVPDLDMTDGVSTAVGLIDPALHGHYPSEGAMTTLPRVSNLDMINGLSTAVDLVDPALHGHHRRAAFVACQIGEAMGLPAAQLGTLNLAAMVHDVGALSLAERLETLNFEESEDAEPGRDWHAEVGYQLLKGFGPLAEAARIVRFHHIEWWEGRGHNHRGREVPQDSHLLHLADRIAVLVQDGKEVLGQAADIRRRILDQKGQMFVPKFVDAFLDAASRETFWLRLDPKAEVNAKPEALQTEPQESDDLEALAALFSQIVDFRSHYTATHSAGVGATAPALGTMAGLPPEDCAVLRVAGHLHDLGKLAVPVEVLEKPSKLTPQQYNLIKSHSYHTYRLLMASGVGEKLAQWAAFHHERPDGEGYPFHSSGDEFSMGSRIVAVADVFTALTEDRPYRKGLSPEACKTLLERMGKAKALDGNLIALLLSRFEELNTARAQGQEEALGQYRAFWDRVGAAVN